MRQWLKQIREEKGWTQEYVAKEIFINRAYYSQIENGVRNPSFEVATKIAAAFDFNPARFFMNSFTSEPFQLALKNAPFVIAHCDLSLRYTWFHHPHGDHHPDEVIGKRDDEIVVNDGVLNLISLKEKIITEGKPFKNIITFPQSIGLRTYYVYGEPVYDDHGEITGAVTASMDITPD